MKKYLFLFLAAAFGSCDYLDVVPESKATFDDIFKSQTECQKFVYYMYQNIPAPLVHCWTPQQMAGDDFISGRMGAVNYFQYKSILYGLESPSQSYFGMWWSGKIEELGNRRTNYNIHASIRHCYMLLNNIDKVPGLTPENYDTWRGEAYFLIGLYHHTLFNYYGPCVIVRDEISADALGESFFPARSTADECVKFICEMYDKAAELLPARRPDAQLNLATAAAAKAYKAQALLTLASPLYNGNTDMADFVNKDGTHLIAQEYDPEKWAAAKEAAEDAFTFCERNGYKLFDEPDSSIADDFDRKVDNYHKVFSDHHNPDEYIFAVGSTYGSQTLIRQSAPRTENPNGSGGYYATGFLGYFVPTFESVEMYYTANGLPWDKDPATRNIDPYAYDAGKETVNLHLYKEPRFYANVGYDRGTYEINGGTMIIKARGGEPHGSTLNITNEAQNCTGYFNKKFINKQNRFDPTTLTISYYHINYPMMRLAELYLNYAEADFEYDGSLSRTGLDCLNKVRSRAGLMSFESSWALAGGIPEGEELRQIIRRERSIEFFIEGHRYFDLRRWKEAPEVMVRKPKAWNLDGRTAEEFYRISSMPELMTRVWKSYWLAIPLQDMNVNLNLVQNPGY